MLLLWKSLRQNYTRKHQNESEVTIAQKLKIGSPERKKQLDKLRLLGDYHHNMSVLETGDGELIVVRRPGPGEICSVEDFLPYCHCMGFIKRIDLWKHAASCSFKPEGEEVKKYESK